jgi:hypothetical protein
VISYVLEELITFIYYPENEADKALRNAGNYPLEYEIS